MTTIETPITKRDGKLTQESRDALAEAYRSLPDGDFVNTVGKKKKKRSIQQLRGIRGTWVPYITDHEGYPDHDNNYVYQSIKVAIGYYENKVNLTTGEVEKVAVRTGGFDMDEFSAFMKAFRDYVEDVDTGLGIRLPDLDPMKARI